MAPLYKRYIPSKTTAVPAPPQPVPTPGTAPAQNSNDAPNKRKRERTEEEVAERKAKKLRKKGIDPATVEIQPKAEAQRETTSGAVKATPPEQFSEDPPKESKEQRQKRHKLNKEAAKARKNAAKAAKDDGAVGAANTVESLDHESPHRTTEAHVGSEGAGQTSAVAEAAHEDSVKRKKRRKDTEPDETRGVTDDNATNGTNIKSKRSEKKTTRPRDHHQTEEAAAHDDQDVEQHQVEETAMHAKSKKRRHKLESVFNESSAQSEDGQHLKKHQNIMNKFQKSTELSQSMPPLPAPTENDQSVPEPVLLDLAPLPQPEQVPTPKFVPDPSSLPEWLAKPDVVSSDNKKSFSDLDLEPKVVEHLNKLGFREALPVQQALIPLLLPPGSKGAHFRPGTESILPDIAVGAPTGSGKTIAYLLPIIEALRARASVDTLKALVVVPTRELVLQVTAVAESLAKGSGLKIGMATGTGSFKDDQAKLIQRGRKYDPEGYRGLLEKAHRRNYPPSEDSSDFEDYLDDLEDEDAKNDQYIQDAVSCLVDHVPTYTSAVDILVATPGRLLEHMNNTLGFSLTHLEWLVLDEADKLLDQQYDGFLKSINAELSRPRREEEQDARERYLRSKFLWDDRRERRVRKVVCSATMTRDVSKLVELRLKRPRMLLVRGANEAVMNGVAGQDQEEVVAEGGDGFELPPTLSEYSVHVGDGSEKPLLLVELLRSKIMPEISTRAGSGLGQINGRESDEVDDSSDSSSGSESESESSVSSVSSDSSSSISEASVDEDDADKPPPAEHAEIETAIHPDRAAMLNGMSKPRQAITPTILIFTSSTESANRLSHLLKILQPEWTPFITTMTKTSDKKQQRHPPTTSSHCHQQQPIITISTDRAARGLDALGIPSSSSSFITHVIQYDIPRTRTSYIHRVGRTARAGRRGEAWTLFEHGQARWFVNEVVRCKEIRRAGGGGVEKVRIVVGEGKERELREAVEGMRGQVVGGEKKKKKGKR